MPRMAIIFVLCLSSATSSRQLCAADWSRIFSDSDEELKRLAADEGAAAAASEIAVGKQWIEQGRLFQKEGKARQASYLALKLPAQLKLVRVLVSTGAVWLKVKQLKQENFALSEELRLLKLRYERLLMRKEGARLSSADPPLKGSAR